MSLSESRCVEKCTSIDFQIAGSNASIVCWSHPFVHSLIHELTGCPALKGWTCLSIFVQK